MSNIVTRGGVLARTTHGNAVPIMLVPEAVGDGVTNDTAAFNAAIAALPATGGIILLEAGKQYAVNLVIARDGVTIMGQTRGGDGNVNGGLTAYDPTQPALQLGDGSSQYRGFTMIGGRIYAQGTKQKGLRIIGMADVNFFGVEIGGFTTYALQITSAAGANSYYIDFSSCKFFATAGLTGAGSRIIDLVFGGGFATTVNFNGGNLDGSAIAGAAFTGPCAMSVGQSVEVRSQGFNFQLAHGKGIRFGGLASRLHANGGIIDCNTPASDVLLEIPSNENSINSFVTGNIRVNGQARNNVPTTIDCRGLTGGGIGYFYNPSIYEPQCYGWIDLVPTTGTDKVRIQPGFGGNPEGSVAGNAGDILVSNSNTGSSNQVFVKTQDSVTGDATKGWQRLASGDYYQQTAPATLASAATVDLLHDPGTFNFVSGTATINSFGTDANIDSGRMRRIQATGAFTIHHATNAIYVLGQVDVTVVAGDVIDLLYQGAATGWRMVGYWRGDGEPFRPGRAALPSGGGGLTSPVGIADGGTGATTAPAARTNLGLGTIATQNANAVAITGGSVAGITDLAIADGGTGASDAPTARSNLGLGSMATQAAGAVAITGGTIAGITDLALADGGTGASDAAGARTNLGLGSAAQVAVPITVANGGTGGTTQATARTGLGLGTIATQDAATVAITGGTIAGITDLAVVDGGTGASDAPTARTNLGLGTIATQSAAAVSITGGTIAGITDLAVGDGGTGASTAAAARTNLGLGTVSTQDANAVTITGGTISGITDLAIADGGTGQSTAVAARDALAPQGADIAAAATTNLATATGPFVNITGAGGPITSLGNAGAGVERITRFTGAPTLTHNATSLILPGGKDITCVANDIAGWLSLGSGNWFLKWFTRGDGRPFLPGRQNWAHVCTSALRITPSAANGAQAAILAGTSTPAESIPVWDFDFATTEYLDIYGALDDSYIPGVSSLFVQIHWMTLATSGNVLWRCCFRRLSAENGQAAVDIDTTAGDYVTSRKSATQAANATAGVLTRATFTFPTGDAGLDGLGPGDSFVCRLYRDASNASDTVNANDVRLLEGSIKILAS